MIDADRQPVRFQFEFNSTFEDSREFGGILTQQIPAPVAAMRALGLVLLVGGLYVVISLLIAGTMSGGLTTRAGVVSAIAIITAIVGSRWLWFRRQPTHCRSAPGSRIDPDDVRSTPFFRAIVVAVVLLLALFFTLPLLLPEARVKDSLVPQIAPVPIMFLLAIAWAMTRSGTTRGRSPLRLEFDEDSVLVEGNEHRRHSWNEVTGFLESPNLFCVYVPGGPIAIPKRVIGEPDSFRALLQRKIASSPQS